MQHVLDRETLYRIKNGARYDVWVTEDVKAKIDELEEKPRARLDTQLDLFAENGPVGLHKKQFAPEGKHPSGLPGVTDISLNAFKPTGQWRLYGHQADFRGRAAFIGANVDASKKTEKADQNLLKRTAKRIAIILQEDALGA